MRGHRSRRSQKRRSWVDPKGERVKISERRRKAKKDEEIKAAKEEIQEKDKEIQEKDKEIQQLEGTLGGSPDTAL